MPRPDLKQRRSRRLRYTVAHRQIVEIDPLADPAPSRPGRHPFAGPRAGRLREAAVSAILTAFANDEMTKKDA